MAWETLSLEKQPEHPGTAVLTIDRPKALNALNRQVIGELAEAITLAETDPEIRVLILTGAGGRAFVAGADIGELQELNASTAYQLARRGESLYDRIEALDVVTIAAIGGFALGGGCELAMACDLRVATIKSKLGVPETSLGTIPGYGGTQRLPRLIGLGRAKELAFTAQPVTAPRAYEIGLINQVVETQEALLPACLDLADHVLKNSFNAVITVKRCMNEGTQMEKTRAIQHEAALFATTFAAPDTQEGICAFLEKRPPKFP